MVHGGHVSKAYDRKSLTPKQGYSRCADSSCLYEQRVGIDRKPMPSTGGRRGYAYFSVLGGEVKKSDFPTASTPPKTGSEASVELDF